MLKLCFGNPSREIKTENWGTRREIIFFKFFFWLTFISFQFPLFRLVIVKHSTISKLSGKEPLHIGHNGHPSALYRQVMYDQVISSGPCHCSTLTKTMPWNTISTPAVCVNQRWGGGKDG